MSHRPLLFATLAPLVAVLALALAVAAADPSAAPSAAATALPAALLEGGDPRSDGDGPGLVGNPLLIMGAVAALGVVTAAVTLLIARLVGRE